MMIYCKLKVSAVINQTNNTLYWKSKYE